MQGMEGAWPSSKCRFSVQPCALLKNTMQALILGSEAEPLLNTLGIVFCFIQDYHSNFLYLIKILIQKYQNWWFVGNHLTIIPLSLWVLKPYQFFSWYFHYSLKGSLSLALIMCQITRKPGPYVTAICWWAQAVLVDKKNPRGLECLRAIVNTATLLGQLHALLLFLSTQHSFPLTKAVDQPQPNFNIQIRKSTFTLNKIP